MSERTSPCEDCGITVHTPGKRGRLVKRCRECQLQWDRNFMNARYVPRAAVYVACIDCGEPFRRTTNRMRCDPCVRKAATRRNREWRRRNPDAAAEFDHRRRARRVANGDFPVSAREWRRMLERYRRRCAYCEGPGPLTREHVIPISRGGRHSIGNLLPVCGSCNYSKNFRLLVEWRAKRRNAA